VLRRDSNKQPTERGSQNRKVIGHKSIGRVRKTQAIIREKAMLRLVIGVKMDWRAPGLIIVIGLLVAGVSRPPL